MSTRLRCEIFPSDLDAAVDFYVSVLRFDVERDDRGAPQPYVALRRDEVLIGAAPGPSDAHPVHRRPRIGVELVLEVDDLDGEFARVSATTPVAEPLTRQPWGLRDFRVTDPDGYYWRITEGPAG